MPNSAPAQSQSSGGIVASDTRAFARAQAPSLVGEAQRADTMLLELPGLEQRIEDASFLIVDLETTGLGARARITEIGAIIVSGGSIGDEFQSMVNPMQAIPPRITSLTGITQSMVEEAETIERVLPSFLTWSGLLSATPPLLVAHNASFDLGFLKRAARRLEIPWPKSGVVDTLALARLALPRPLVSNHKLSTLVSHFKVDPGHAHRALADARATWHVLEALVQLMQPNGMSSVSDLLKYARPLPRGRYPHTPSGSIPQPFSRSQPTERSPERENSAVPRAKTHKS